MKLVLGARPSGSGSIDASLSIRFDVSQIERFPQLERVGNQSVRDLALEVLGADHAQHAAALAAVSADTPLVTVVGGRLIARGEIPPALLANEDDFRHQVFDRFSAEYEKLLPAGPVNWRQLLNLIAAVGPLTPTAKQFVEPAAEILHIRPDEIASAIDLLEKHGLLLRGGRLVRIVPDLAALRILSQEAQQQKEATASAQESLQIFTNRYIGGRDPYLQVLTAQTIALQNERNDVDILRRRMDASVLLIKALGGGWTVSELPKKAELR